MFENMLGKKSSDKKVNKKQHEIAQKVSTMNLVEMRTYVNDRITNFRICDIGLIEVMKRLNSIDANTKKRFIEIDAMDSKVKKALDLVILICHSKKMTVATTELVTEFIKQYSDIIDKYDKNNKQIYAQKLKNALNLAILTLGEMAKMRRKSGVLH